VKPRHRVVGVRKSRLLSMLPFAALALLLHLVVLTAAAVVIPHIKVEPKPRPGVVELVSLDLPQAPTAEEEVEEEVEEEEPEEEKKDFDGQIVEIAPPLLEEKPEDAEYLAEYDQKVEEEMRSEKFKINPEIIAREYSEQEKVEIKGEQVPDLQITKPSTGATAGSDSRFDPDRDGMLAQLPSPYSETNKDGTASPVPSAALESVLAGSPSNDRLNEKKGSQTLLNTKEFQYASYILRVRRLVQFYWNQNIENLPASVRLAKPEYTTVVNAVLDGDGTLEKCEVTTESGSVELDDAVVRAFKVAGPFPNPPEGLVEKDGRVYLPDMGFTVVLGVAQMKYEGIDPRAGVQFPGILKSPR
jgi:TonB family protein